jgi:hypothetical protein
MVTPPGAVFACWHDAVAETKGSNAAVNRRNLNDMIFLTLKRATI